jgi:hypothetical protein
MSVKPYFWPENTHDVELDELEAPVELDKPEVFAELDKLEAHLPTLEVP